MNNERILIFDTTLRDGEQSPGASMTSVEKLDLAHALARLGVDIIEAGFPAASPDDFDAVQRIAAEIGTDRDTPSGRPPVICGLSRTNKNDIDRVWEAVRHAERGRIHTFLATSEIHMRHKLNMTREQVLERVREMVAYARSLCADVEFSPEDAGRSDPEFLYHVLGEAVKAGATTLNIPDTVGYTTPEEFGALIGGIIANTPGIEKCIVSTHCHNDLGLATANTLAGLRAGARQAEVTINGIGERAGNTSLEEIVMALRTRRAVYGLDTGIDTTQIMHLSKLVTNYTGIAVQPNKAIVGANAFAHEAGIHQDGMLKHNETYEIMRPESVGVSQTKLVLGKHSGRHAFKVRLAELGHSLSDEDIQKTFASFKKLADKKKVITDADLEAIVADGFYKPVEVYTLEALQVACGTMGMPTATVRLRTYDGKLLVRAAVGDGPVDACYKAIDAIVGNSHRLIGFAVHGVTEGKDAIGGVTVRVQGVHSDGGVPAKDTQPERTYTGYGVDTDIIVAGARAYLSALNKLFVVTQSHAHAPGAQDDSSRSTPAHESR